MHDPYDPRRTIANYWRCHDLPTHLNFISSGGHKIVKRWYGFRELLKKIKFKDLFLLTLGIYSLKIKLGIFQMSYKCLVNHSIIVI